VLNKILSIMVGLVVMGSISFAAPNVHLMPVMNLYEEIDSVNTETAAINTWETFTIPAGTRRIRVYSQNLGELNFNATSNAKQKELFGLLDYQVFELPVPGALTGYIKHDVATGDYNIIFEGDL